MGNPNGHMAYNMGQGGARKALANGTTETDYTKKVMEVMNNET